MHSLFSPSQLHRIIACPSSVQLYKEVKPAQQSSSYAEEGTLLHSYMEKALSLGELPQIPDAEHRAVCQEALDYVNTFITSTTIPFVEVSAKINAVPEVFGTSDVVLVDNHARTIHIMDYKFGANIAVHAENNPQFMAYALGAIDTLKLDTTHSIYIHVIQPRKNIYEEVEVTYDKLIKWQNEVLIPAIAKAQSDKPYFGPSEEACRWCTVKAVCPAYKEAADQAAETVFAAYKAIEQNWAISQDELIKFYESVAVLKDRIKAVEDYILSSLMAGRSIPGYKVVRTRGRRKFKDEALAAKYLFQHYNADPEDVYDTTMKSPSKLEKLYKGLAKDDGFKKLIEVPLGSPTVVKESDSREALDPFSSVKEEKI